MHVYVSVCAVCVRICVFIGFFDISSFPVYLVLEIKFENFPSKILKIHNSFHFHIFLYFGNVRSIFKAASVQFWRHKKQRKTSDKQLLWDFPVPEHTSTQHLVAKVGWNWQKPVWASLMCMASGQYQEQCGLSHHF